MKQALISLLLAFALCLGHPGALAAQTEEAVEEAIRLTLASQEDIPASRSGQLRFVSRPSDAQTVPSVSSDASAIFTLQFNGDLSKARYNLTVFNGTGIVQAHLHCAPAGVAGPIFVFLFGPVAEGVDVNGSLISGEITNADILPQDPPSELCGVTITNLASVLAAIRQDRVYVNIHTVANPPGELRDQLFGN